MIAVLVGVTVAAVKMVGKVNFASRNPVLLLGGYLRQTCRPMNGTLAGRKLAEPRPHRFANSIDVTYTSLDESALNLIDPSIPSQAAAPAQLLPTAPVPQSDRVDTTLAGPADRSDPGRCSHTATSGGEERPQFGTNRASTRCPDCPRSTPFRSGGIPGRGCNCPGHTN